MMEVEATVKEIARTVVDVTTDSDGMPEIVVNYSLLGHKGDKRTFTFLGAHELDASMRLQGERSSPNRRGGNHTDRFGA